MPGPTPAELADPRPFWWMSFSGPSGALGACIVQAANEAEALTVSHLRGCNPGGSVAMVRFDRSKAPADFGGMETHRFYTKAEILAAGGFTTRRLRDRHDMTCACDECNRLHGRKN